MGVVEVEGQPSLWRGRSSPQTKGPRWAHCHRLEGHTGCLARYAPRQGRRGVYTRAKKTKSIHGVGSVAEVTSKCR